MQIMMSSTEAPQIINRSYAGGSNPISTNMRPAAAQFLDWWRTRGKRKRSSRLGSEPRSISTSTSSLGPRRR